MVTGFEEEQLRTNKKIAEGLFALTKSIHALTEQVSFLEKRIYQLTESNNYKR